MMRCARNSFAYAAGVFLAGLVLEGILRLLPVPMGLYRTEHYERWPLLNYEPHHTYSSSMSWELRHPRHGSTNNYGHIAPFDFIAGSRPVIVIGDSFVESQMNRYEDTLQGRLGALIGRTDAVYGLGANGLSISDYLALSALAAQEFSPTAAVFLLIDGDVSESLMQQIGHYDFSVSPAGVTLNYRPLYGETLAKRVRRAIGDSALFRYLQLNLRFDPERLVGRATKAVLRNGGQDPSPPPKLAESQAAIEYFLDRLAPELHLAPACVVLLLHSDTYAIASPAEAVAAKDPPQVLDFFRVHARSLGYRVVDLKEKFRADYASHGRGLDFWPLDRHLSGRGHGIAAQAAFDALYSGGDRCRPGRVQAPTVETRGETLVPATIAHAR